MSAALDRYTSGGWDWADEGLSKLANWAAKTWRKSGGVINLRDPERRGRLLRMTEVGEVLGVGGRLTVRLRPLGIQTAWDLAQYEPASLRRQFSVVLEKTARELRGVSCLELEEAVPPRQMICFSKMLNREATGASQRTRRSQPRTRLVVRIPRMFAAPFPAVHPMVRIEHGAAVIL